MSANPAAAPADHKDDSQLRQKRMLAELRGQVLVRDEEFALRAESVDAHFAPPQEPSAGRSLLDTTISDRRILTVQSSKRA